MNIYDSLDDYFFYAQEFLKIKTKVDGLQILKLREYQSKFVRFVQEIQGPVRIVVLKPRQAGFSTLVASLFCHKMFTQEHFTGIVMADKKARTDAIADIYSTFLKELEPGLRPMIDVNNSERLVLDNPNVRDREKYPGLSSGLIYETANDPNAGRSTSRVFAHLSEWAFCRYADKIDDGVQNSIPLVSGTYIIKESTANGRAGEGKAFYNLWQQAKLGESIYKPFFVAWYEIDDYLMVPEKGFKLTGYEKELKSEYNIPNERLMWRRQKIREYSSSSELSILSPEERFKQDFPVNDTEAFLSTGSPVFDLEMVERMIKTLNASKGNNYNSMVKQDAYMLQRHMDSLRIHTPPRSGMKYYIGADIAEGLAQGDFSSAFVIDHEYRQVASWHGRIDPDLFGHLLIDLGRMYNNALIVPESNSMGHTTTVTIRNDGYGNLYKEQYEDKITKEKSVRYGWRTTTKSKMDMLNEFIKVLREDTIMIRDLGLAIEMGEVVREDNGNVNLNGKDRVVAACLACVARRQNHIEIIKDKRSSEIYDTYKPKKKNYEIFT
jgi:hypothetical protein